jgi:hypothetical protein
MASEIQLFAYGYDALLGAPMPRATTKPLRQRELCDQHAAWLMANRRIVHDLKSGEQRLEP